ncbi:heptaprenyl diphosphate synthase component 1 [Brevibacillus sp. 7WMA2]|uniref:heptaprenyl diphosphate synthase component 1 n=1 Tax=Brevibacillus TaxID=55080 RepID=UPI0002403B20|nr:MULTISPECIES: heptaprenyl diphosphate synthase component 1 [Brevibacillus]AUM64809.1 heptaprenyl diphosphate synthase [Brevibacillus laterosporus]MBA4534048.1 heptaprenyl diphosphate synthase component 1 [Brevibacillus halotolerans]MCR8964492.1 heptaprenyl diphosphate synthase component 1 [Brevibacillus laterosporus]MCR8995311.1 heptaprenyl diphosphate synthase component 1 [Brevibacillus laterosporus]MCZ0836647.1 heptaprenyl diphosphate synthase component 1 [Brevibacillus halotolerans]
MGTDRNAYSQELKAIIEEIQGRIQQTYIQQYVDVPAMAENRLALLFFFLHENGFTKERAHLLSVATGFVQLGIDTHETVRNHYEKTLVSERNRQLTVLAGDYYSSLYYNILADANEIEAIQVLAVGNQLAHETKMKLYIAQKENKLTQETYLSLRKKIDTALYVAFVDKYAKNDSVREFWTSLFEQTSAFEQLIGEWEQLQWQEQAPNGLTQFLLQKPGSTIANAVEMIEGKVMELLHICEQLIVTLKSGDTQSELAWMTSRYTNRVQRLKRAEEM